MNHVTQLGLGLFLIGAVYSLGTSQYHMYLSAFFSVTAALVFIFNKRLSKE